MRRATATADGHRRRRPSAPGSLGGAPTSHGPRTRRLPDHRSAVAARGSGHRGGGRGARAARRRGRLRPPAAGLGDPPSTDGTTRLARVAAPARRAPRPAEQQLAVERAGRSRRSPGEIPVGQHARLRRDRAERHVRLHRQPRRRRRHRRRHRHRQGRRHHPHPGRTTAVPGLRPRRHTPLRQRLQRPRPLDQRGRRARHPDQHGAHHHQGRHPALRAGRQTRRVGDLRPEPRLRHRVGHRHRHRHASSPTSGSSPTRTGSSSPRTAPGPTPPTTSRTWSASSTPPPATWSPRSRCRCSPHSVAVHPTEPLVANVNYDSNSVTVIDTNTDKVDRHRPGRHASAGRHLGAGRPAPVRRRTSTATT